MVNVKEPIVYSADQLPAAVAASAGGQALLFFYADGQRLLGFVKRVTHQGVTLEKIDLLDPCYEAHPITVSVSREGLEAIIVVNPYKIILDVGCVVSRYSVDIIRPLATNGAT